jgi:hypothetical protein
MWVPAAMTPVCIVPLLGGIAEVCWHGPRSHLELVDVSRQKPRSRRDRHDDGILDVVPLLGTSHLETQLVISFRIQRRVVHRMGSPVEAVDLLKQLA